MWFTFHRLIRQEPWRLNVEVALVFLDSLFHSAPSSAPPRARLVLNPCTSPVRALKSPLHHTVPWKKFTAKNLIFSFAPVPATPDLLTSGTDA